MKSTSFQTDNQVFETRKRPAWVLPGRFWLASLIAGGIIWGVAPNASLAWVVQDAPFESTQTSNPNPGEAAPPQSAAELLAAQQAAQQGASQQTAAQRAAAAKEAAAIKKKAAENPIPPPANITIDTSDGVILHCTYLAPAVGSESASGKTTLPFILLHDWEGSRADLLPFGLFLQKLGCAVIVPDLRGHGQSTSVTGSTTTIDHSKFRKTEMESVLKDIESCKKYLVQRNNNGELNIDMLNVVAVGKTAVLATKWTLADWFAFPPIQGGIKQGQDVRSLTLIAPQRRLDNLNLNTDIRHPLFAGRTGPNLPTLIVWPASDADLADEGSAIYERMKKGRPDVESIEDAVERDKATTLYHVAMPQTNATGTVLIRDNPVQGLWPYVAKFVATQVGTKRDNYPWQSREKK